MQIIANKQDDENIISSSIMILRNVYQLNSEYVNTLISSNKESFIKLIFFLISQDSSLILTQGLKLLRLIVQNYKILIQSTIQQITIILLKNIETMRDDESDLNECSEMIWTLSEMIKNYTNELFTLLPNIVNLSVKIMVSDDLGIEMIKSLLYLISTITAIDCKYFLPSITLITGDFFVGLIEIQADTLRKEILVNLSKMIIPFIDTCKSNSKTIIKVYKFCVEHDNSLVPLVQSLIQAFSA